MKTTTTEKELQELLAPFKKEGKTIGFVPTMGALHSGHISLITAAKKECDIVVCSIFVNPTQFDKEADLVNYPITIEADSKLLSDADCDFLILPSVQEVYPNGKDDYTAPNIGPIVNILEGQHRKGHFNGVMQVVERLLRMTTATHLYMGLKDYQQYLICWKMASAVGLNVEMRGMPIVREEDGLAKSSRNVRLTKEGRKTAVYLSKRLKKTRDLLPINNIKRLEKKAQEFYDKKAGIDLEYFEIVDRDTLMKPNGKSKKDSLIALMAAWVDGVRLIDNMVLS
jgi:pantoate--beta-alanine ligase